MSTDPPAGYDPDTWKAAITQMREVIDPWVVGPLQAAAALRAALAVLGAGETVEWAIRYDEGHIRIKDNREHAEDIARIVVLSYGDPTAAEAVWRRVGPWTPVEVTNGT